MANGFAFIDLKPVIEISSTILNALNTSKDEKASSRTIFKTNIIDYK